MNLFAFIVCLFFFCCILHPDLSLSSSLVITLSINYPHVPELCKLQNYIPCKRNGTWNSDSTLHYTLKSVLEWQSSINPKTSS